MSPIFESSSRADHSLQASSQPAVLSTQSASLNARSAKQKWAFSSLPDGFAVPLPHAEVVRSYETARNDEHIFVASRALRALALPCSIK